MATTVQNPFDTQQASATDTGIIGSAIQAGSTPSELTTASANNVATTAAPAADTVSAYNPTTRQIDQPTGTVQGQVNSILATDNPLMQRARTLATQQMAQRGLVNTSMNAGAGVAAMTDKAIQIGSQDANAYNQAASENMAAKNVSGQFNAGALNTAALQKGQQTFTASQNKAQQDFTAAQTALERAQQVALADKSIEAQQALQKAQQDFSGAQAALDRSQQTSLANLQITAQKDIQGAQQQFQSAQSALDRAQQLAITDKSIAAQQALQKAQQDFTGAQAVLDRQQQTEIANRQIEANKTLQENQQKFQAVQASFDRQQQFQIADFQNSLSQANVSKAFAANVSSSALTSMNAIAADPNMSAEAKKVALANVIDSSNNTLKWASSFYGTSNPLIEKPVEPKPTPAPAPAPVYYGDSGY